MEKSHDQMAFQGYIWRFLWLFFTVSAVSGIDERNQTQSNSTVLCERVHEYDKLDIRRVTGVWKAVELYKHLIKEGVNKYNSCPVITIWEAEEFPRSTFGPSTENQLFHVQQINAKFRQQYRSLRLLWDEAGQTVEYSLYFRNDSAGYWQVLNEQNGTLAIRPNYQQFSGTVQVLKAVNDHLVLNFCQEPANGRTAQLFSALFSREPGRMPRWEIESVHSLLQNKKLSVASRRMVCGGAEKPFFSLALTTVMVFFSRLVRSG